MYVRLSLAYRKSFAQQVVTGVHRSIYPLYTIELEEGTYVCIENTKAVNRLTQLQYTI